MYEPQRHENYKNKIICKQCSMFHSLSSQCQQINYKKQFRFMLNLAPIM